MSEPVVQGSAETTTNGDPSSGTKNFHSSEVLLSVIQNEFSYEADKVKSLETRTGVFMTFAGALLVFLLTNIKIPSMNTKKSIVVSDVIPYIWFTIFAGFAFILLLGSIFCFIKVISVQSYKKLNLTGFNSQLAAVIQENVEVGLIEEYQEIILFNRKTNDRKIKWYAAGLYLMLGSLIAAVLTYGFSIMLST